MRRIKIYSNHSANNLAIKTLLLLLSVTTILATILTSSTTSADGSSDTEVIDQVRLTVPVACTMAGIGTTHTATLSPGTYSGASGNEYENGIGKTTLTAICNDDNGFSIYAIGFTGNQYEGENHTKLVGTNTNGTIATKAYAAGDTTSNWSMKLTKVTNPGSGDPITYNPENLTITTNYDNWIAVPATYTKVAQYKANTGSSATDTTLGVKLETTYAAYIASNQAADTYVGQVKYTMVHPYTGEPLGPQPATPGYISYYPNGNNAVGTMGNYELTALERKDWSECVNGTDYATECYDSEYNAVPIEDLPDNDYYLSDLLASNYSRDGYGFAGWSDKFDYATNNEAHFYGPQESIEIPVDTASNGLSFYAVWIPSAGSLQDGSKVSELCGTGTGSLTTAPTNGIADLSSVSALTDQRDNQTYAIAKLADGNCWMIENLRLESTAAHNSDGTLAQGYGISATYGNFSGLADAESANFTNSTTANSLYYSGTQSGDATINIGTSDHPDLRMPRYNNLNTQSRASNPTSNTFPNDNTTGGMYSYGNYYTWPAAMANTIYYNGPTATDADGKTSETVNTSLCPTGWRLPYGRNSGNGLVAGGFYNLNYKINNNSNVTNSTASKKMRAFPNNFIYSGEFYNSTTNRRGSFGDYWSSTALNISYSYSLGLDRSNVGSGISIYYKGYGYCIRCTVSAGT